MADLSSVGIILDFLRRNRLAKAEAALLSELNNRQDVNGFLDKLNLEEKALHKSEGVDNRGKDSHYNVDVSEELIVKEIECGVVEMLRKAKVKMLPLGNGKSLMKWLGQVTNTLLSP